MTDVATTLTDEDVEAGRLAWALGLVAAELERVSGAVTASSATVGDLKGYLWDHQRDMDGAEKANIRQIVNMSVSQGHHNVKTKQRLERLLDSPYFGRVDFQPGGELDARDFYVGVHNFRDPVSQEIVVHDWRAPVSSLYYDFETGEASYEAPEGTISGEITGKRQYKIVDGRLEYMFDSAITIGDDVLQRELGHAASEKMRNIVATIQREQNAVIRNETARVLILQGVAGSGKTSIALHRVAFLLYRFKDTLTSDDIMILSPNRIFGDYIARVLPELGEEQIAELGFDAIAERFLAKVTGYQTFSEQVASILGRVDEAAADRMRFKATPEFVTLLTEWITETAEADFTPGVIERAGTRLSADWVAESYGLYEGLPVFTRLDQVADRAVQSMREVVTRRSGKWKASDTTSVRTQVRAMFAHKDALALYRAFHEHPDRRGLFRPLGRKRIEYADVFPLILTMLRTTRTEGYGHIRHLLVDEMQDYTPVQYAVLRELFSCPMTILGDSNQSVNPFSSSHPATIHEMFPEADRLELNKSYRSTAEITDFAQQISRNDSLVPVARHGQPPRVVACTTPEDEVARILDLLGTHRRSGHQSVGIVCKTVSQAHDLHRELADAGVELTFLDYESSAFTGGIVITSAHISKGLEFDAVIVPHVDEETYATEVDRSMLYIACTRAMHELHLTHAGPLTPYLRFAAA